MKSPKYEILFSVRVPYFALRQIDLLRSPIAARFTTARGIITKMDVQGPRRAALCRIRWNGTYQCSVLRILMAWTSQRLGLRSSLMDARATKLRTGEESQCALLAARDLPVFPDSSTNLFLLSALTILTINTEHSSFPPNPSAFEIDCDLRLRLSFYLSYDIWYIL